MVISYEIVIDPKSHNPADHVVVDAGTTVIAPVLETVICPKTKLPNAILTKHEKN